MAANVVNLDALIPREDFAVTSDTGNITKIERLQIRDLEDGFFYQALRKPDFQRETANWTPTKVLDLVRTFLDGDLIPAVILWQSGKDVFVIDGAHRLSALIAWVHDDYGDGKKSRDFFQNYIPPEQIKVADRTRKLVSGEVGTYAEYQTASRFPDRSRPEVVERARALGYLALPIQWVPAGDAAKAEASFFKINQAATEIDQTELRILQSRQSPNALAARAIVRSGTGHKYWSGFQEAARKTIEGLGKDVYSVLYHPPLENPIKTLDLPIAGSGYGALPLIFDLVNLANGIRLTESRKTKKSLVVLPEDKDGSKTITFLQNVEAIVRRISGANPASLGLHPVVYFYSGAGSYQPAAFLGVASFIKALDSSNRLVRFTKIRGAFEEFFIAQKNFISQVVHKFGSAGRSAPWIKELLERVFTHLESGLDRPQIVAALQTDKDFEFLRADEPPFQASADPSARGFTRKTKSAAFIREAVAAALKCPLCGGLLHRNSMQSDHIERKRDGGLSTDDNAQITHPFCNSTVKN